MTGRSIAWTPKGIRSRAGMPTGLRKTSTIPWGSAGLVALKNGLVYAVAHAR